MDSFDKYYNLALRFLSFRIRSEKELRDYLKRKKAPQNLLEQIIDKLKSQKFVNDEEFAKMWIESRLRVKPRSIKLLALELRQKGIDNDIIEKMIKDEGLMIKDDLENAKKLLEKKFPKYKNLDKREIYQKLGSFLARKGFDFGTLKKAIDEVIGREV